MLENIARPQFNENLSHDISQALMEIAKKRRSTRNFTGELIPDNIIQNSIEIAGSAPSGANRQPWLFNVTKSTKGKQIIKEICEMEERDFYIHKPNKKWVEDLRPFHTNEDKSFLLDSSHIISIFYQNINRDNLEAQKNYYAKESTGIACGMLINNLHLSGVSTLTYTPKRMQSMRKLFGLDNSWLPFMLVIAGIAPKSLEVPQMTKKSIDEICRFWQ